MGEEPKAGKVVLLPEKNERTPEEKEFKAFMEKYGYESAILIMSTADECICDGTTAEGEQSMHVVGHGCLLVVMLEAFAASYPELYHGLQKRLFAKLIERFADAGPDGDIPIGHA